MKIARHRIEPFLNAGDPTICCVLLFGPDAGLVRERADTLAAAVVSDLDDPFLITILTGGQLKGDIALLFDEAMALSLTGGERVIRVRDASDNLTPIFKDLLGEARKHSLVVVEAGDLPKRSSLRKCFEQANTAAAIGCYADDGKNLEHLIRETLNSYGLSPDPDALSFLTNNFGGDRMVVRQELYKLALYVSGGGGGGGGAGAGAGAGANEVVKLPDVINCIGDSAKFSLETIAYAVADGDQFRLDKALERAELGNISSVAVLREVQRHLQRLHLAVAQVAAGKNPDQVVADFRPKVFFKFKDQFLRQVRAWAPRRLNGALELLIQAEIECKLTGFPEFLVCGRTLMRITQMAHG